MYLSKYLSSCGVCSRRKAAELVKAGKVFVNCQVATKLTYIVKNSDKIVCDGKVVSEKEKIYILMNKPSGFITTMSDPQKRPIVISLLEKKLQKLGVHPIGRLDLNTTGVLLFTNDGDLTYKLAHPKFNIPKTYFVTLDKVFKSKDFLNLSNGVFLYDGFIKPDKLKYASKNKRKVIVQIHSGKKRIVRRMFRHLKYYVKSLDRIDYAGLTSKGVARGGWRFFRKSEVEKLKDRKFPI